MTVDQETLGSLNQVMDAWHECAARLMDLEQEKIKVMFAARQLEAEKLKILEKICVDNGLSPGTPVEIDSRTGEITVLTPES
jgi:hypothetical protein